MFEWYSADFGGKESALLWVQGLLSPLRRDELGQMFDSLLEQAAGTKDMLEFETYKWDFRYIL